MSLKTTTELVSVAGTTGFVHTKERSAHVIDAGRQDDWAALLNLTFDRPTAVSKWLTPAMTMLMV
jgi:hypothetical protein